MNNKITMMQDDWGKNIEQFHTEIERWKQLPNAGMEENVLLKNRISDILINNYDQSSLEEIEEFQNQFIREDELIYTLKTEVNASDNLLYNKISEKGKIGKPLYKKMNALRKDINNFKTGFLILKLAFNDFQHKISGRSENYKL